MSASPDHHRTVSTPGHYGRIPDDLPVLLRTGRLRYGWQLSHRVLLTVHLPIAAVFALVGLRSWVVAAGLISLTALLFAARFADFALKAGRTLLGADEHGLFLRPNGSQRYVTYLPWLQIKDLAVRRCGGVWMLCVTPTDPELKGLEHDSLVAGPNVGFFQFNTYMNTVKRVGTTLFVPVVGTDPQELAATLSRLRSTPISGGREASVR